MCTAFRDQSMLKFKIPARCPSLSVAVIPVAQRPKTHRGRALAPTVTHFSQDKYVPLLRACEEARTHISYLNLDNK